MKRIGVVIERQDDRIKPAMLGVITAARGDGRSQGDGHELYALTFEGAWKCCRDELTAYGIDRIVDLRSDAGSLAHGPDARARAVVLAMEELELRFLFGLASPAGRDLLARVAAALDAPLLLDCLEVDLETSTAKKLLYSGKTVGTIRARGSHLIFGMRPNAVEPRQRPGEARVVPFERRVDLDGVELLATRQGDGGGVVLGEAEIIISGGRGLRGPEGFELLKECADVLGAAVGASRVAVDAGWVPHSMQVGQTGATVSPRLYIACGISGAVQHFAGMSSARTLVAVNSDRDAAMMQSCDYGIVGDLLEILPILTQQLKKTLEPP